MDGVMCLQVPADAPGAAYRMLQNILADVTECKRSEP